MSVETNTEGQPVHMPADPEKFQFDPEVASLFVNMAERSIPNFRLAHQAHARMLEPWLTKQGASVLDIGASRGTFLQEVISLYGVEDLQLFAMDNSQAMCDYMRKDLPPKVGVSCVDVTSNEFLNYTGAFDVVCLHYVLQFVPPMYQRKVLLKVMSMVKRGGVLVFGHKSKHYGSLGGLAHEEYINFRLKNGYTMAEIEAKTAALKGSMNPMNHEQLLTTVRMSFREVQETTRFMMFSTFMAVK